VHSESGRSRGKLEGNSSLSLSLSLSLPGWIRCGKHEAEATHRRLPAAAASTVRPAIKIPIPIPIPPRNEQRRGRAVRETARTLLCRRGRRCLPPPCWFVRIGGRSSTSAIPLFCEYSGSQPLEKNEIIFMFTSRVCRVRLWWGGPPAYLDTFRLPSLPRKSWRVVHESRVAYLERRIAAGLPSIKTTLGAHRLIRIPVAADTKRGTQVSRFPIPFFLFPTPTHSPAVSNSRKVLVRWVLSSSSSSSCAPFVKVARSSHRLFVSSRRLTRAPPAYANTARNRVFSNSMRLVVMQRQPSALLLAPFVFLSAATVGRAAYCAAELGAWNECLHDLVGGQGVQKCADCIGLSNIAITQFTQCDQITQNHCFYQNACSLACDSRCQGLYEEYLGCFWGSDCYTGCSGERPVSTDRLCADEEVAAGRCVDDTGDGVDACLSCLQDLVPESDGRTCEASELYTCRASEECPECGSCETELVTMVNCYNKLSCDPFTCSDGGGNDNGDEGADDDDDNSVPFTDDDDDNVVQGGDDGDDDDDNIVQGGDDDGHAAAAADDDDATDVLGEAYVGFNDDDDDDDDGSRRGLAERGGARQEQQRQHQHQQPQPQLHLLRGGF
jgi:hypothetical protein